MAISVNDLLALNILNKHNGPDNYFKDALIQGLNGDKYYIPPPDSQLTFKIINNKIEPVIGKVTDLTQFSLIMIVDEFSEAFDDRFNLLCKSVTDIESVLGRPLSVEETKAKKIVDDLLLCNSTKTSILDEVEVDKKETITGGRLRGRPPRQK